MDSANGSYMHYNNSNDNDLSQFLHGVHDFADLDGDQPTHFDPALFADNGLVSFPQQAQPSRPAQSPFTQAQRQAHSQSPALPQFKPDQNAYLPQNYGSNAYNQRPMGQSFDPQLLSRPTPSPGPFDQYAYQPQPMNYGQPQFDYSYNAFQQQRQSSTPSQAFRPQVSQQAQHYMNAARPSPQPQAHMQQSQPSNNMSYPFQQIHQSQHRFVEPSMLNAQGQLHQGIPQMQSSRQMEASPYFTKAGQGATLDPRALQMQQYAQMQQAQGQNIQPRQQGAMHPQSSMQCVVQFPAQAMATIRGGNAIPKVERPVKSSGGVSASDDDLDIEDEEPPETRPAVITIAKPINDERGKLLWEVVDAVWAPKNRPAPPDKIRSAVRFVGEAVRNLRDKWKETNDKLKKAENANQPTEGYKVAVGTYREIMETLAGRVTNFGHPSILKRLGENLILLSAMYSFLVDRANAEDYDSPLIVAILQLGIKLETVDEEQLEKVKWTKVLVSRFAKKSTNASKLYAQQIIVNAKKATARKKAEAAGQGPASPSGSSTGQIAGVKRPREGSEPPQQAKKAVVKPSSKPLSVQIAEREKKLKEKEKAERAAATKDTKSVTTNSANAASVAARPKTTQAPPQKASPFASLMSAKKRPGTTNAERAAKEKVDAAKNATTPPGVAPKKEPVIARSEAPAPKPAVSATPSSSFLGSLFADMEKPKENPKAKVEVELDETPEARAKRLRKESRRKLRVTWKPEGELVETKVFEHDSDEETGHDDSQMRDVGDTGKEGEMLKHRISVEDDEDSDSGDDEPSMPPMEYFTPSEVDFSSMKQKPEDDFDTTNFIKGGGNLRPESSSSAAQDKYESGNLMRMYAAGEQPSSPTEPLEADDDDFSPVVDFGEPGEDRVRRREQRYLASRQAYQQPPQPQANGFNLASAMSQLQPQQQQHNPSQMDWLQALGMANQQPQQQAQFQQQNPQLDLSKILAVAQQMHQQPSYQGPVQPVAPAASNATVTPDVAAILSQLSGGIQQPQPGLNASIPTSFGENSNSFSGTSSSKTDRGDKKEKKRGKNGVPLTDDGLPVNYKTKVCQFWLEGKCTKGNSCTYKHEPENL